MEFLTRAWAAEVRAMWEERTENAGIHNLLFVIQY